MRKHYTSETNHYPHLKIFYGHHTPKPSRSIKNKDKTRKTYGEELCHIHGILRIANLIRINMEEGAFPRNSNLHDLKKSYAQHVLLGNMRPVYLKNQIKTN